MKELEKKLDKLNHEIGEVDRCILYLSIELHKDYLDYLEMDKLISDKIEFALKRDLELNEEFEETFKNLFRFNNNEAGIDGLYDEIENIGLDSKTLKNRLIELNNENIGRKEDYFENKERIIEIKEKLNKLMYE